MSNAYYKALSSEATSLHQPILMSMSKFLLIKDNPWPFINLAKLAPNARMGDGEVVELLKIANGYLPRVRLEYDRVKAELNSWKAELSNTVQIYQQFIDRNIELKKREDELQFTINELEEDRAELQKTTTEPKRYVSELQENNAYNDNLNPEIKQEEIIFTNDKSIPSSNMVIDYLPNEMNRFVILPKLSHQHLEL